MKNVYETFVKMVCINCKNKQSCNEELRMRIDNTIKCSKYEGSDT